MKIIGHRGAKGLAPENTLAGLQKALEHQVDEIEFDVRVTKDAVPILAHDPTIHDAAGDSLQIKRLSYDELKAHKPDLITLKEVFKLLPKTTLLLIEVKPNEPITPIIAVIQQALDVGRRTDSLSLGSFSQKTLRQLHRELPDITKVVIESWSGVRARFRAHQVNTKRLNMRASWLWSGFLAGMQRGGYQISPYTINNPAKAKKWEKYLYGVITDFPDRFQP